MVVLTPAPPRTADAKVRPRISSFFLYYHDLAGNGTTPTVVVVHRDHLCCQPQPNASFSRVVIVFSYHQLPPSKLSPNGSISRVRVVFCQRRPPQPRQTTTTCDAMMTTK